MAKNTIAYYNQTSEEYDTLHGDSQNQEYNLALERSWPLIQPLGIRSVLDVGCGTGRSLRWMSQRQPDLDLHGLDPSEGLLRIAREHLPQAQFQVGLGETIPLEDRSVDLVVASGIMHHVDQPGRVIRELFRVANRAVLVSDHNNFAFGSPLKRRFRLWLYASGLFGLTSFIKQGFRRQGYSQEDGWWYPYSLLRDFGPFSRNAKAVYLIPSARAKRGDFLPLALSHLAILGLKEEEPPSPAAQP